MKMRVRKKINWMKRMVGSGRNGSLHGTDDTGIGTGRGRRRHGNADHIGRSSGGFT